MLRSGWLIVAITAVIVALAVAVSLITDRRDNHANNASQGTLPISKTPSHLDIGPPIASDDLSPSRFMVCELLMPPQAGTPVRATNHPAATAPEGFAAVYKPNSCEPDIDAEGRVAVRTSNNESARILPVLVPAFSARSHAVWSPAKATVGAHAVALTGDLIQPHAELYLAAFDEPLVFLPTTDDGAIALGSQH